MENRIIKIGEFGEGTAKHSIYKNHNEELIKNIQAVERPDYFTSNSKAGKTRVVSELSETEVLCINEENSHSVVSKKLLAEYLEREYLRLINRNYPINKYFL